MPSETISCIRHGESTFNAAWRVNPVDPLHFDARLSDVGRAQVAQAIDLAQLVDDAWSHQEGEPDTRGICVEPIEVVPARAARFRAHVMARPERVLALVGHGTFFFHLADKVMANCKILELAW